MKGKKIAFWVWVLVVVVGAGFAGISGTTDDVYTGTKIEFNTSRDIQIDTETATFEAASKDFFVLRKESGETIVGVPTVRPLGWSYDKYYVATSQEVSGGRWLFQDGSATVRITSPKAITVRLVEQLSFVDVWFMTVLGAVAVWLFGLLWYFIMAD